MCSEVKRSVQYITPKEDYFAFQDYDASTYAGILTRSDGPVVLDTERERKR